MKFIAFESLTAILNLTGLVCRTLSASKDIELLLLLKRRKLY